MHISPFQNAKLSFKLKIVHNSVLGLVFIKIKMSGLNFRKS